MPYALIASILSRAETQPYACAIVSDGERPTPSGVTRFSTQSSRSGPPSFCIHEVGIELFARAYETLG